MPLGPIQGWNAVCCTIFHDSRCCERARVVDGASPNWAAYRAANSPRCQKPLESAHALICSVLPPASNCLLTAIAAPSEDIDEGSCRESSASRCESPDIQCSLSAC